MKIPPIENRILQPSNTNNKFTTKICFKQQYSVLNSSNFILTSRIVTRIFIFFRAIFGEMEGKKLKRLVENDDSDDEQPVTKKLNIKDNATDILTGSSTVSYKNNYKLL